MSAALFASRIHSTTGRSARGGRRVCERRAPGPAAQDRDRPMPVMMSVPPRLRAGPLPAGAGEPEEDQYGFVETIHVSRVEAAM